MRKSEPAAGNAVAVKPVPILLYHSVSDDVSAPFRPWTVPPRLFEEHMGYLVSHGFTPMTVSAFVDRVMHRGEHVEKPVVVTFDDGFADTHTHALPVLSRFGIPATLYVVTGAIGRTSRWLRDQGEGDRPILDWAQLRELASEGVECGAHGLAHRMLDTMPFSAACAQIVRSKQVLEDGLAMEVRSFAYPHGYYTRRLQECVRETGYSSAAGVKHAMSAGNDDVYALARIIIRPDTGVSSFGRLLSGDGLRVAPKRAVLQTAGWRMLRKAKEMMSDGPQDRGNAWSL
ncbi:MAG: polysaccharide deacetylase family protein [Dehalococcoidia bacterium]